MKQHTKEDVINEYKKLKEHLGSPPSSVVFFKETGLNKRLLEKLFGSNSYSKLVIECGDTPNIFSKEKSDLESILTQWGKLARNFKGIPPASEWAFNNCKPSESGIRQSHNIKWADLPYKFLEYNSDKEEWSDVIALIPIRSENKISVSKTTLKIEGLKYEDLKFIPPVVQDLLDLSVDEEKSRDFEKSVNLIFQMLGFDVRDYGQGSGRNPDGVAKSPESGYAILIDAKSRKDNYKIGQEDRKFIEYIKTHSEPLRKSGFAQIYFLIVSSSFENISTIAIKNIKTETQVSTTFLSSKLLLKLLSYKIKNPRLFDSKKFKELLIEDGEITEKKIDKFITDLNKS